MPRTASGDGRDAGGRATPGAVAGTAVECMPVAPGILPTATLPTSVWVARRRDVRSGASVRVIENDNGDAGEHQQRADQHARVEVDLTEQQPGEQRHEHRVADLDQAREGGVLVADCLEQQHRAGKAGERNQQDRPTLAPFQLLPYTEIGRQRGIKNGAASSIGSTVRNNTVNSDSRLRAWSSKG